MNSCLKGAKGAKIVKGDGGGGRGSGLNAPKDAKKPSGFGPGNSNNNVKTPRNNGAAGKKQVISEGSNTSMRMSST